MAIETVAIGCFREPYWSCAVQLSDPDMRKRIDTGLNKRLWSNLDCAPSNETLVKTFAPGEQVTTSVTWTGMGSGPHCPLRPAIGPGTYNLVVQLGNLRSLAVPFIMAPPLPPGAAPPPAARISRPAGTWAAARTATRPRRLS